MSVPRTVIVGSGSEIPPNCITNDMLATVMDTTDEWIKERSGVETRYYVNEGTSTLDLAAPAATRALEAARVAPEDVDLVVFATMTPDHYMPGNGGLLRHRLGLRHIPCFDIRQQCAGFVYGLQLADAHIRSGLARTVLLVGAEVHTGLAPYGPVSWARLAGATDEAVPQEEWDRTSSLRHVAVLFGDGAAAVVLRAQEDTDRGILDQILCADGTHFDKLCVPGAGSRHRPYISAEDIRRGQHLPVMDGRAVFKMATTKMAEVARDILARNGLGIGDLSMVLMHQANLRINEFVQSRLELPAHKVLHNIQRYGNTTAATIPLLWDECARTGRIVAGDLVLCVAFGAGMNWGATLIRA
jgi:3-oxoacyl-[acyl-carrier-protein] synthase-3